MADQAYVFLMGRATSEPKLYNIEDENKCSRAVFNIAINLPIRKDGQKITKAIFRRCIAWGSHADYIHAAAQRDDGLKGRLINIFGTMDTDKFIDNAGQDVEYDFIRVEKITIFDRRIKTEETILYDNED